MNKFFLIATILLFPVMVESQDINYRPYISTRMAKILMDKDITPDDENKLCDGSGWITHGDGHKTECPGCDACKGDKPNVEPVEEKCTCGCEKVGCKCMTSGQCFPLSDKKEAVIEEIKYHVYHLGATWCPPCQRMKKETWEDEEVLKLIEERQGELHLYDMDNPSHKKFFDYYKVGLVPTIIIVKSDDLENPVYRSSGFIGPDKMQQILEGLKNGE